MLWFAVQHERKEALAIFSREIAPAGTGMGESFFNVFNSGFRLV